MPRPKAQKNDIKFKYSKHEIVWAKIAGYPWWPASITCTPSKSNCFYKVDFIGDRSYAYLSESKIAKYVQLRDEYEINKKNNKHFSNAVTIAARKYQELLLKQGLVMKSKGSIECKTSQQNKQLNKQIELPEIQEKIQQISSQNQNEKNILHDVKYEKKEYSQQFNNHFDQKQQQIQEPIQQTFQQTTPSQQKIQNDMIQQSGSAQMSEQTRQILIQRLLAKYKLDCIPLLKQQKKFDPQAQLKKPLHKRKLIFKGKKPSNYTPQQLTSYELLTKKIYRHLFLKLGSIQSSIQVSLSLQSQIIKENPSNQKAECLKKVLDWIEISDNQHIISYHSRWLNFNKQNDRQRQKHSNLTMQDESGESISIK